MRQFWLLHGPGWRLPIRVHRQPDSLSGICRFGPNLPNIQKRVIAQRLTELAYEKRGFGWWLMIEDLRRVAREVGNDWEEHIIWHPTPKGHSNWNGSFDHYSNRKFIRGLVDAGHFGTVEAAELVWGIMCRHMLNELANHKRPVNLGFATLHALPYRKNWMTVLFRTDYAENARQNKWINAMDKWSNASRAKWKNPKTDRLMYATDKQRIIDRLGRKFLEGELFAFTRKQTLNWTLEVVPTSGWRRLIEQIELKRAEGSYNVLNYFKKVLDVVKAKIPEAVHVYSAHLADIALPMLQLFFRSGTGRVDLKRSPIVIPSKFELGDDIAQLRVRTPRGPDGTKIPLDEAVSRLSEVSESQPEVENVWDARGDVDEPHDRNGRDAGVPVRDVVQSKVP